MTIDIEVAERFGALLASGNYGEAHGCLTQAAGRENPPEVLKRDFEAMISYWWTGILNVKSALILEDWPDKQEGDLGMVYISFIGDGKRESVTVVLVEEDDAVRIRSLHWGEFNHVSPLYSVSKKRDTKRKIRGSVKILIWLGVITGIIALPIIMGLMLGLGSCPLISPPIFPCDPIRQFLAPFWAIYSISSILIIFPILAILWIIYIIVALIDALGS
jgi:hypothetical protein